MSERSPEMSPEMHVRRRRTRFTPEHLRELYGDFAEAVYSDERFRKELRDRLAFVHVTGILPSHLRPTYARALVRATCASREPTSLDGRSGRVRVNEEIVVHLQLDAHPMVREVRRRIAKDYFIIQNYNVPSTRGSRVGTSFTPLRRNYGKVRMHKIGNNTMIHGAVTIMGNGAVLEGWS